MKASTFKHPRHDNVRLVVVGLTLYVYDQNDMCLGTLDPNDVDRLLAVADHAVTRTQGILDIAEFCEDCLDASLAQGLCAAEILTMCSEQILIAFYEDARYI